MDILMLILVGAAVGVIARFLMPGRDPIGLLGTILVGIVGAIAGGYMWRAAFGNTEDVEWIGSVLFAMALLFLYRKLAYGRSTNV